MYLDTATPAAEISAPAPEFSAARNSAQVPRTSPPVSAEISVLTYNVRGLPWPVALGRGEALHRIGQELASLRREGRQPDVVLIQEGFRGEMSDLVKESGYRHWAKGPGRGSGLTRLTGAGLHVLADAPIVRVRNVVFRDCAGLDCLAAKGAMLVRLAPEGAPTPIDIVNTHLNSRSASRAPPAVSLAAHNSQSRQLNAFIAQAREPGVPMVVGGDFNVKNAPQRYYYGALERPYTVVSEFCSQDRTSGCGQGAPDLTDEPWLKSQDLQAFGADDQVQVRPIAAQGVFMRANNPAPLSDHDGYLVRYQVQWQAASAVWASGSVQVKPRLGTWGVKVSWKR